MPPSTSADLNTDAHDLVVKCAKTYAALRHDKTLCKTFHEACKWLSPFAEILRDFQSQHAQNDQASLEMHRLVKIKAETYGNILETIEKTPEDRPAGYQQAVTKWGHGATVEELSIGMMDDLRPYAEKLGLKDRVETLRKARKSLCNMEPSLAAKSDIRYAGVVSGDQFNAVNGGVANTNKGSGGTSFLGGDFTAPLYIGVPP